MGLIQSQTLQVQSFQVSSADSHFRHYALPPPLCFLCVIAQSLGPVTPWIAARQASLSFTVSWSLLKLLSTESMMPSNHLILCHPLYAGIFF